MKVTAVIPVRKGSQRVKDKNLRPFANTTLLDNKLQMLLQVPELDSIIVNTNSEAAIELVELEYANTKVSYYRREEYYASSQCSGSEFFKGYWLINRPPSSSIVNMFCWLRIMT